MRAEEPLDWMRSRGEGVRMARIAKRSERDAGRFEAVGSDPGGLTARLMRGGGPLLPMHGGGSPLRELDGGHDVQPGAARRWWDACTRLAIEGLLLWGVGWLLDRIFGFGAALMAIGSLIWLVAFIGMLITPIIWAAEMAAKGVRQARGRGDLPA